MGSKFTSWLTYRVVLKDDDNWKGWTELMSCGWGVRRRSLHRRFPHTCTLPQAAPHARAARASVIPTAASVVHEADTLAGGGEIPTTASFALAMPRVWPTRCRQ